MDKVEPRIFAHDPQKKGYTLTYKLGQVNHCPGCGRTHWMIGRVSAECGFCSTALPLDNPPSYGSSLVRIVRHRDRDPYLVAA